MAQHARLPGDATLSALVRRACGIVDPDDEDAVVGEFELRHEDADEPVRGVLDSLEERIGFGADEDPAVTMAQAVVLYLAHRRDEVGDDPEDILALAARAEFDGNPPASVQQWLDERGVRV
jgi:hypothetical protein